MIRRAFTMRLKPDALAEYKRHHDQVWPELVAEIERSGIAQITTFQRGLDLFLFSQINDLSAWDRLWTSDVHRRWAKVMEPLMHLRDDGIVDAGELTEIFHLQIPAASQQRPPAGRKATPGGRKPVPKAAKAKPKVKKAAGKASKKKAAAKPAKKKSVARKKSGPRRK